MPAGGAGGAGVSDVMDAVGIPGRDRELRAQVTTLYLSHSERCSLSTTSPYQSEPLGRYPTKGLVAHALQCPCCFITIPLGTVSPSEFAPIAVVCLLSICLAWFHLLVVHCLGRKLEDYLCVVVTL